MPTLLLRFCAPIMSFGDHSNFTIRDTRREPTKSAVIGLLCAALGRTRDKPVNDLASLNMGIRVNQEGIVQCDFQTASDFIKSNGTEGKNVISNRYYLADADFLIGLEGEMTLLETLNQSVKSPHWALCFGRKNCVPSLPVDVPNDGIVDLPLETALIQHRMIMFTSQREKWVAKKLRFVLDTDESLDVRRDVPICFENRLFGSRCVKTVYHFVEG